MAGGSKKGKEQNSGKKEKKKRQKIDHGLEDFGKGQGRVGQERRGVEKQDGGGGVVKKEKKQKKNKRSDTVRADVPETKREQSLESLESSANMQDRLTSKVMESWGVSEYTEALRTGACGTAEKNCRNNLGVLLFQQVCVCAFARAFAWACPRGWARDCFAG